MAKYCVRIEGTVEVEAESQEEALDRVGEMEWDELVTLTVDVPREATPALPLFRWRDVKPNYQPASEARAGARPACGAEDDGFVCTREKGHEGPHVAHVHMPPERCVARWIA